MFGKVSVATFKLDVNTYDDWQQALTRLPYMIKNLKGKNLWSIMTIEVVLHREKSLMEEAINFRVLELPKR